MATQTESKKYPSLAITYVLIFCVGASCMAVAGYFLIEGLSQFAGGESTQRMLIIGGILFQITESICFISASALTYHSKRWRFMLLSLGFVLFGFSIAVMTLAQKTALETGENQAHAIDEKRNQLRNQITSLQKVIDTYRFNAQRQSRSIYKDSRAAGQDSLNRAAKLEERKLQLSNALFTLNQQRQQTSSDFFKRVEEVTGLSAASTEFYFLVVRSLLLELSAILLMSFAANLRAYNQLVIATQDHEQVHIQASLVQKVLARLARNRPKEKDSDGVNTGDLHKENVSGSSAATSTTPAQQPVAASMPTGQSPAATRKSGPKRTTRVVTAQDEEEASPAHIDRLKKTDVSSQQINLYISMVADLYEQSVLRDLEPDSIKQGLKQFQGQRVSDETARILSKAMRSRIDQPC